MARQLPPSITHAVRTLGALVALSAVAVLLVWLQTDDVIRSWARGNSSAQEILAAGGMPALRQAAIVPKFVPLAIVAFVVFVVLVVVLAAFLVDGHGWARIVLCALSVFGGGVAVLAMTHSLPIGFTIVSVLSLVLYVVLVVLLWRKDTSTYLRVN